MATPSAAHWSERPVGRARRNHLIIADDHEDMRWLVRKLVGVQFSRVDEDADGRMLLWRLLRTDFADERERLVVIADAAMPIYNGLDVLHATSDLLEHVPIIVITAFPSPATEVRVAALGGILLAKPFAADELIAAVERARML